MAIQRLTIYDLAGGQDVFFHLADTFYQRIDTDPLLRPMFPANLAGPRERLALFLIQYFGGPATYSEQRGHPRLRMRHIPFSIGQAERDAWLAHMLAAIDLVGIPEPARAQMRDYFERSATFMINRDDTGQP